MRVLGRSIRYHRPRAPLCGIGACSQCLVRVNGWPNVRACQYVAQPLDRVEAGNAWPSPRFDLLGALDFLFYRGLDTLHGFRRPRWATPLYHRVVRRLAGYDRLADSDAPVPSGTGEHLETDVLVIGGGKSGQRAAGVLAARGRRVLVIDRRPELSSIPGAVVRAWTTATFLPPPVAGRDRPFELIAVERRDHGLSVRARQVVVAVGGYDAGLLFDGNDRPGVHTAEGVEAFAVNGGPVPFERAVVFGGGTRAEAMLARFGSAVEAVVAPGPIAPAVADEAARLEVPLYPRTLLVAAQGRSRVRNVTLLPRGGGPSFDLTADAVVLAHRRLPNAQLFFQAGARMEWRAATGAYYPELSGPSGTSVPGLFAVGEAAGYVPASGGPGSGAAAAAQILGESAIDPGPRVERDVPGEMAGYLRELRPMLTPRRRVFICACEDILLGEVEEATRRGYRGVEVVKRYTGLGTGLCQGRYCLPDALLVLSDLENRPPAEVGYITQRPPVFPTSLAALAGLGDGTGDPTSR